MKYSLTSGLVFGLLSLAIFGWLAFGLVWQRGLYMDDYVWFSDIQTRAPGELALLNVQPATSPARAFVPITIGMAFQILARSEWVFRAIAGVWTLANGMLAGLFAHRVTGRSLVGIYTAALFGFPFVAAEAVLWTGAFPYVVATSLALATLHFIWTALTGERKWVIWALVAAASCGLTLLFFEAFVSIAGFAILLIPLAATKRYEIPRKHIAWRAIAISALCVGVILVFFALYYIGSPVLEGRGGLVTDPGQLMVRITGWFQRLHWMVLSPVYGRQVFVEALSLGLATVARHTIAATLAVVALALAFVWLSEAIENSKPVSGSRSYLIWAIAFGIIWFVLGLSIPGVFASGQILESRLLYFPYAGIALTIAAVIDLGMQFVPPHFRLALGALPVLWMVGSALTLTGYAQGFALRYGLDQAQVAKLASVLAPADLPDEVVVVPVSTTEAISAVGMNLTSVYVGVFETSWSASSAMNLTDDRSLYRFVTGNRWVPLDIACLSISQIKVGNERFQAEQVVLFSLAPDLVLYDSVVSPDGSPMCETDLPAISGIEERAGDEEVVLRPLATSSP